MNIEELNNSVWTSAIQLPKQDGSYEIIPVKTNVLTDSTTISGDGLTSPIGLTNTVTTLIENIVASAVTWNSIPAAPDNTDNKIYGLKNGTWVNIEDEVKISAVLINDLFVTNPQGKAELYSTYSAGTPIETIVSDILNRDVPPSIKMAITPSTKIYECGTSGNLSEISITAQAGSESITGYSINVNNEITSAYTLNPPIAPGKSMNIKSVLSYDLSNNASIKTTVSTNTTAVNASTNIYFVWPYFYGLSDTSYIDISTGTKLLESKGNKTVEYIFDTDTESKYMWFASDPSYGNIKSFKDKDGDELASIWKLQTSAMYNGYNYNIYITDEDKTATAKMTFAY